MVLQNFGTQNHIPHLCSLQLLLQLEGSNTGHGHWHLTPRSSVLSVGKPNLVLGLVKFPRLGLDQEPEGLGSALHMRLVLGSMKTPGWSIMRELATTQNLKEEQLPALCAFSERESFTGTRTGFCCLSQKKPQNADTCREHFQDKQGVTNTPH